MGEREEGASRGRDGRLVPGERGAPLQARAGEAGLGVSDLIRVLGGRMIQAMALTR